MKWRLVGRLEEPDRNEWHIPMDQICLCMGGVVHVGDVVGVSFTPTTGNMRAGALFVTDIWYREGMVESIRLSAPLNRIPASSAHDYLFAATPDNSLEARLTRLEMALGLPAWNGGQ